MWLYFLLVFIVIAWGAHIAWRWKAAKDFAPQLLASRKESGELPAQVDEKEFTDLYVRAEGPRAATYIYACGAFLTFGLPPLTSVYNSVWETFWRLSGGSPVFEQGTLIHTFSFFLAFMGLAILILTIALRRYYTLMPPNLRQVIRNLKDAHS
ncbi:MAG: hypothetical protein CVT79_11240 [Alphaproteobacteria bacterium HGW-Alphaproteobacteria-18]|nr:MAG: hypothetical protein CVT79_11240 [Alphaproteobacteria bacterium HGW-Alphaproteobacteria-18]